MFKVSTNHFRLLFTAIMIFGCLLIVSACGGDSSTTNNVDGKNNDESSTPDGKDEFINKGIYSLPGYEEVLGKYESLAFTFNGHENRVEFLGEEEIDGVMTEHYYLKVASDYGDDEYEVWMNDEGLAEKAIALGYEDSDYGADTAHTWIGDALKPFYEFNATFRYPIDYGDFTVDSHETKNDKLLDYDVVFHTIKGIDKYHASGEVEYEVIVADAGEFEFLLEYEFYDEHNEQYTFDLTEMELR